MDASRKSSQVNIECTFVFILCSVSFIVCVVLFDRGVILCDVCYLFVVYYCKPLPVGKNPFAVNKYYITSPDKGQKGQTCSRYLMYNTSIPKQVC
jgi:hypothetical protein